MMEHNERDLNDFQIASQTKFVELDNLYKRLYLNNTGNSKEQTQLKLSRTSTG